MGASGGIRPAPTNLVLVHEPGRWSDWYAVSQAHAALVHAAPSLRYVPPKGRDPERWLVHRSHLPLLRAQGVNVVPDDARFVPSWSQLRAYQVEGAAYVRARRGALLADDLRTGKTFSAVGAHEIEDGPLYIFAPLATRSVWLRCLNIRWPGRPVAVLQGRTFNPDTVEYVQRTPDGVERFSAALSRAKLVFAHYDILPAWQSLAWVRPARMIFDEIHVFSSSGRRKPLRGEAAVMLARQADAVVGLTGTPLWNEPAGVHTILSVLNGTAAWGTYWKFAERYASGRKGPYGFVAGEPSNVDEFRLRLAEVMIRRLRRDVFADLPETQRSVITVELTYEDERAIDFAAAEMQDSLKTQTVIGQMAKLRRILGEKKIGHAMPHIEARLDEPLVIWTWHVDVAKELQGAIKRRNPGIPTYRVTGRMPAQIRETVLDEWRESPRGVLLLTIACGQLGIDLSHARRAMFVELDFTPATIGQAEMRCFSPERPSEVVYLAVSHHVDQEIVKALQTKLNNADLMGLPAADAAIDLLGTTFGVEDAGDLDRLQAAILAVETSREEGEP